MAALHKHSAILPTLVCLAMCAPALIGCDQDLPQLSLIDEMDIFGARVEVEGEPGRSMPKPGETARVELSLVYPEFDAADEDLSIAVLECTFPDRFLSIPFCQEFVDFLEMGAEGSGDKPAPKITELDGPLNCDGDKTLSVGPFTLHCLSGKRAFDFTVADDFESDRRLFMGIVCRHGTAQFITGDDSAGLGVKCEGDDNQLEEEAFYLSARVQQDGDSTGPANQNPSLDGAVLKIDGKIWPQADLGAAPSATACAGSQPGWPVAEPGKSIDIEVSLPDTNRENIDKRGEATVEDLRVSLGATAGEFERSASYITNRREADKDGMLKTTVVWTAPEMTDTSKPAQRRVHFHFAVRDGRGGFATIQRFACVE